MHGLVFKQLKGYVVDEHGRDAWTEVVESVPEGRQAYLPVRSYPDEEFAGLLAAASDLGGDGERAVERSVGEHLGAELHNTYASVIDAEWGYFDLLEHVAAVADSARTGNDADPPHLAVDRDGDGQVTVTYASDRRRCDLGKGIAVGLAAEYDADVSVRERACMHDGGRECEIVVEST